MSDITEASRALIARILEGSAQSDRAERLCAFDNAGLDGPVAALLDKTARHAYRVTDEDVDRVKAAGLSEDQTFELVVCAAVGQATRLHDSALAALQAATQQVGSKHAPIDPR